MSNAFFLEKESWTAVLTAQPLRVHYRADSNFLSFYKKFVSVRTEEFVRSISFPPKGRISANRAESVWRRAGLCARVCVVDIVKMDGVLRLSLPSALYSGGSSISLSSFHLTKGTLPPANFFLARILTSYCARDRSRLNALGSGMNAFG